MSLTLPKNKGNSLRIQDSGTSKFSFEIYCPLKADAFIEGKNRQSRNFFSSEVKTIIEMKKNTDLITINKCWFLSFDLQLTCMS